MSVPEPSPSRRLLDLAGAFYYTAAETHAGEDEGMADMLNLNDTFAWACADCEHVSEEEMPTVAGLFRQYGDCGIFYWVWKVKRAETGWPEFLDIRRMIEFVANEERIRAECEDNSQYAYKAASYTLGLPAE